MILCTYVRISPRVSFSDRKKVSIEDPHVAEPEGILVGLLVMNILTGVTDRIFIRLLTSVDGTSTSSKASNTQ